MSVPAVEKRVAVEIEASAKIPDVKLIKPKVFPDDRGFFSETYNITEWAEKLNFKEVFMQDNHSFSKYGVLRGLHTQPGMGKLVSVVSERQAQKIRGVKVNQKRVAGEIFDVAVDARRDSPTFGQWHSAILTGKNKHAFWVPPGFLHGFLVLSKEGAHVTYKCTAVYDPKTEFGINPFDEEIAVEWPISDRAEILVSERDTQHEGFASLRR